MTVLFDLDGTLCSDDQDPATMLGAAFDRAGVAPFCTAETLVDTWTEVGSVADDVAFYREQFRLVAERAGSDAPDPRSPTIDDLAHAYDDERDHTAVSFVPGAEAALNAALASDRRVGLVTNGGRDTQTTKLEALGVRECFDVCVFSTGDVPAKPQPEPFERALDALGADPSESVMVGDRLGADVAGAERLGVGTVWYRRDGGVPGPTDPTPDRVVDSMAEVASLLRDG